MIKLNEESRRAWKRFLNNKENSGHAERKLIGGDIDSHVGICFASAVSTVGRVRKDIGDKFCPQNILEIGSSTGLNCFALQREFKGATVVGIEPEVEAIAVATAMISENESNRHPKFIRGYGERLPLKSGVFDLILCHTVIEHVKDVPLVISEMARVLREGGIIHLEAPNYNYPYEPHLGVFTIPGLGKSFVKLAAVVQGKSKQTGFVDHLQFVTPGYLEKIFDANNLQWRNRAVEKLEAAARGDADIRKYRSLASVLNVLNRVGVADPLVWVLDKIGFYPSVMYTLKKQEFR